jgi:UDP-N-acetylglucosamine--N-acetylmuramyl-(pentapeptide) pyrophosphoryl-undecaprenol N-acetylglucosamine transferase
MRAIIAGGGTGGHVIPALAIGQELKRLYNCELAFVGTARGIETKLVPAAGFELKLIDVGQLNRVSLATRLKTLVRLPMSIGAAMRILSDFRPDVIISVGGYASGPAAIAAILRGVPLLIFEPNYVPGFANRKVARWAKAAAVYFKETRRDFKNAEVTGVPVRSAFFEVPARPAGSQPTLLLFGGSQGARALNRVLVESAFQLKARIPNLRIIHQTGKPEFEKIAEAYRSAGVQVEVWPFINDMPTRFAEADLIVCRSGASTVAEVAAAGKAAIFIPLPTAADDHQRLNAASLADKGAAVLLPESELTRERFVAELTSLFADPARLAGIGESARRLSHPDAAAHIARMAAKLAGAT